MDCRILSDLMVKKATSSAPDSTRMYGYSAAGDFSNDPYPLRTAWLLIWQPQ
jgi:hypothetical protein